MFSSRAVGFGISLVCVAAAFGGSPFDVNGDAAINLLDYQRLAICLGSGGPDQPSGVECAALHADADADIDLADAAGFQNAFSGTELINNSCASPIALGDGTRPFTNVEATTDGSADILCDFFNTDQIDRDVWFCYTATCSGTATFGSCGSEFDTKLAVYPGCACPDGSPTACSDDDCGTGAGNFQSRVEIEVEQGLTYMVRVGGYDQAQGIGLLTIGCNVQSCQTATHDCFVPSPAGEAGCADSACCTSTCEVDLFCCDVTWDATCAAQAEGVCNGNFASCLAGTGACDSQHGNPGCNDQVCCNRVCLLDSFCCLTEWDATCASSANAACFLTCGAGAFGESCLVGHATPGCSDQACCELVCTEDDFCCDTEWDALCAKKALTLCP